MVYPVQSLGLHGITGYPVSVECDLSGGLPAFTIVGLPDAAVNEARERVRSAVKNCGFTFPVSRITVNLAPANQRKGGTVYDLPILAGILAAGGQLRLDGPDSAYVGELSLSGSLRPVVGMDKEEIVQIARKIGTFETSIQPYEDCCTVFLPKHPSTKPKLDRIIESESKLDVDQLVEAAVASEEIVQIRQN